MAGVSQRAYARHRGVTLKAVQKALSSGRIHADDKGKIDAKRADRQWAENTDPDQQARGIQSRGPGRPGAAPDGGAVGATLQKATAQRQIYKAKLAELEYEEAAGRLISAEAVRLRWTQLITDARTKLLSIPTKLKTRLPHLTTDDIHALEALVKDILDDLARGGERKPPKNG